MDYYYTFKPSVSQKPNQSTSKPSDTGEFGGYGVQNPPQGTNPFATGKLNDALNEVMFEEQSKLMNTTGVKSFDLSGETGCDLFAEFCEGIQSQSEKAPNVLYNVHLIGIDEQKRVVIEFLKTLNPLILSFITVLGCSSVSKENLGFFIQKMPNLKKCYAKHICSAYNNPLSPLKTGSITTFYCDSVSNVHIELNSPLEHLEMGSIEKTSLKAENIETINRIAIGKIDRESTVCLKNLKVLKTLTLDTSNYNRNQFSPNIILSGFPNLTGWNEGVINVIIHQQSMNLTGLITY